MMTKLINECEMVANFLDQNPNKEGTYFVREVPLFAKSVDLVKVDRERQLITAIEFKTTKWKKAVLQVLGSAITFDYLEICVLKPATVKCQEAIIKHCQSQGIGLYFIDNETKKIEHILKPIHRIGIWEIQRNQIMQYLEEQKQNG